MNYKIFINSLSSYHKEMLSKHCAEGLKGGYNLYKKNDIFKLSPNLFAQFYLTFHSPEDSYTRKNSNRLDVIENLIIRYLCNKREKYITNLVVSFVENSFYISLTREEHKQAINLIEDCKGELDDLSDFGHSFFT